MAEVKRLTFKVKGEFITSLAREKVYQEGDMKYAVKLLLSCMEGTDLPERELRQMAFSIINGEARLKGTYPEADYGFEYLKEIDGRYNLSEHLARLHEKYESAKAEAGKMTEWYNIAMEHVPDYRWDDVFVKTGQKKEESFFGNSLLDSFMQRVTEDSEHSTGDYGWLEPNGTFHDVEWGEHQEWAQNYIEGKHPEFEEDADMQMKCGVGLIGAGDWLVERGWVLMHNPSQGIAFPTRNPVGMFTKAQKEFLYDYYMERNCENKANEIYMNEED